MAKEYAGKALPARAWGEKRGGAFVTVWTDREHADERFDDLDLIDAELRGCRFTRCSFRGVRMDEAATRGCAFDACDFTGARLNASVHEGSAFPNCRFDLANLFTARFADCKMTGAFFGDANLAAITIAGGDWSYTILAYGDLSKRDLRKVRFNEATLHRCNLERADLRGADLTRADLSQARLKGADLRGAIVDGIDLKALDLTGVRLDLMQAVLLAQCHGAKVDLGGD